jgi:CheY-like chemotaxis protein
MAIKILLVEDDINLGEIYQARLQAEGFQIVSAKDGEEALAMAVKEHPDLIVSDIMMPKISGFDMLDILRSTEGIKNTKVIMMTALGGADDKFRAEKLGADLYLVKSQVTLEDVVKAVHDTLNDTASGHQSTIYAASDIGSTVPAPAQVPGPAPAMPVAAPPAAVQQPMAPTSSPVAAPTATMSPSQPATPTDQSMGQTASQEQSAVESQIEDIIGSPTSVSGTSNPPMPAAEPASAPAGHAENDHVALNKKLIITPPTDGMAARSDIHTLLQAEEQKAAAAQQSAPPPPAAPTGNGDPNNIAL